MALCLSGCSEINEVPLETMGKHDEAALQRLFGHKTVPVRQAVRHLPDSIRHAPGDDGRRARSLIVTMLAHYQTHRVDLDPNDKAEALARRLIEKGQPIQCYAGGRSATEANRKVACLSPDGPIKLCRSEDHLNGKSKRGCGVPNKTVWGSKDCKATSHGVVCYCEGDLCNSARRRVGSMLSWAVLIVALVVRQL